MHSFLAQGLHRLSDRRQPRMEEICPLKIIESNNSNVFGNANAGVPQTPHHTNCHSVVGSEQGGRRVLKRKQLPHTSIRTQLIRVAADEERRIIIQVSGRQGAAIAFDALLAGSKSLQPGDHADASVPESGEVTDDRFRGCDVLRRNLVDVKRSESIDQHQRNPPAFHALQSSRRGNRRRKDQTIDAATQQILNRVQLHGWKIAGLGKQQRVTRLGQLALNDMREVRERGIRDRGHGKADRLRAPHGQRAGNVIVHIAGLLDGRVNGISRLREDRPGAVDNV